MSQVVSPIPDLKFIFKIVQNIPEKEQVIIKFCRQNGPTPIDDIPAVAIDYGLLDFASPDRLFHSLSNVGMHIVENQLRNEPVLNENNILSTMETTDLNDYVDKVVGIDYDQFFVDISKYDYIEKINLDL